MRETEADRPRRPGRRLEPGDDLDAVFGALADPTRRTVLARLMADDAHSISAPELRAELPMSRQAVAKHLQVLDDSGLIERMATQGKQVRYRLAPEALSPAIDWMAQADAIWAGRLDRLKRAAESG